jgi:hypothetical protein
MHLQNMDSHAGLVANLDINTLANKFRSLITITTVNLPVPMIKKGQKF